MIILYWSEQISRNCTYLLPNIRSTHTVKNYFPPMTVYRFGVDPQGKLRRHVKPKNKLFQQRPFSGDGVMILNDTKPL